MTTSVAADESALWALMQQINAAWIRRRPGDMATMLHESMVMVTAGAETPVRGRDSCVDSYRDFLVHATVVHFDEHLLGVDVFGDMALVTYDSELTFGLGAKWTTERRREAWAFVREDARWLAVWRTQFPTDTVIAAGERAQTPMIRSA